MYIYFYTLGCKVNQYETAALAQLFSEKGYITVNDPSAADVCVINSCTVTAESDSKTRQTLGRLRKQSQNAVIAVTGCYPQAEKNIAELLPEADIITGTKNRTKLPELVEEYFENHKRNVSVEKMNARESYEAFECKAIAGHTRAFVKIQDGCNQFCTYCLIPYARGPVRSRPVEQVLSEMKSLAENGYREVVLTGINLAFYGADISSDIADITERISRIDGIERIRLSSLEPERLTDDITDRLTAVPKLCPSFHLSLQSGCDKTLAAMGRRYTSADFERIAEKLRSRYDMCSLTTDVITGFPGETEEDFVQSMEFVKKIGFSSVHVFPYSERKGTKAAEMTGMVDMSIRRQRASRLGAEVRDLRRSYHEKHIGMTVPVLFEHEKADGIHRGHTKDGVLIKCLNNYDEKSLHNQIFYVTIEEADDDCCIGSIVTK